MEVNVIKELLEGNKEQVEENKEQVGENNEQIEEKQVQDDIINKAIDDLFSKKDEKESDNTGEKQEQKQEQKEEQKEELQDGDKSSKAFASMRAEIKALKQALEERDKKLSAIEQYKQRIAELEDKLGRYSIVEMPQFIETFEKPRAEIESQLVKVFKEFEIEDAEKAVISLLSMPLRKRTEWLKENLPDIAQTVLNTTIQYDTLTEKRNNVIQNHKQYLEQWQKEVSKKKSIEDMKLRQQVMEKAITDLVDQKLFIIQPSESNEAQNKLFNFVKERINYLFKTDDLVEQAKALILGAVAPVYLQMMLAERDKRLQLEDKINKKSNINKTGKQQADVNISSNDEKGKNAMSIDEALEKLFSKKA